MSASGLVYGVRLRGDLPAGFERYLRPAGSGAPGRVGALAVRFRSRRGLPEIDPIWTAEPTAEAGSRLALFREPAGFGLTVACDGSGVFRIRRQEIRIEWLPGGAGPAHYFFSYALPLWLESRGVPMLHASAVAFGDRAVAFVGPSGIGKSTLCARLVRSGCRFVADDGLPLREGADGEWRCSPGPPWFRLWPSALERHLGVPARELPRVRASLEKRLLACDDDAVARDAGADMRLDAVYVLEGGTREDGAPAGAAYTAREALIRLIEHSLAGAPVAALGLSAARLERLSRLAARTPVRHLRLPAGGDRWEIVRRVIAGDLPSADDPDRPRP